MPLPDAARELTYTGEREMVERALTVPYGTTGVIKEIRDNTHVLKEDYEEKGTVFTVRGQPEIVARLESLLRGER